MRELRIGLFEQGTDKGREVRGLVDETNPVDVQMNAEEALTVLLLDNGALGDLVSVDVEVRPFSTEQLQRELRAAQIAAGQEPTG